MKYLHQRILFSLILLLFIFILFYNTESVGKLMYPIQYQQEIMKSAEQFQIDPLLIAAIIRTESNYRPYLESSMKATGLMQIIPSTADWIIMRAGYSSQMKEQLLEPDVNIELGAWYLHWLSERFSHLMDYKQSDSDRIAILAAGYNAGHNKLAEWLMNDVWNGQYHNRDQIPYGETRHYVKRVVYYYNKYHQFYTEFDLKNEEALNSMHMSH